MSDHQGRVAGKVALITGAAQGMGAAHARVARARGRQRSPIADIATDAGERLAGELRDAGGRSSYHDHDVTDPDAWRELVAAVEQAHGPIDVLVNNAGIQVRSVGIEADDDGVGQGDRGQPAWRVPRHASRHTRA